MNNKFQGEKAMDYVDVLFRNHQVSQLPKA